MQIPFLSRGLQRHFCGSAHTRAWWIFCRECLESCIDQGSACTSLWKQGTEHYSSVGGRQIWLTPSLQSSQVWGTFHPYTWKDRWTEQFLTCVNYLWPVLFPAKWLSKQANYWFSWWLSIKNYEVMLWNMTLKKISVSQLNAGAATQSMQWTINKL